MHLKKFANQRETRTIDPRQPKPCKTCGAMMNPAMHPRMSTKMWEAREYCSRACVERKRKPHLVDPAESAPPPAIGTCAAGCGRDLWQEQIERGETYCWRCQDAGLDRVLEFKRKRDGYHVKANGASA